MYNVFSKILPFYTHAIKRLALYADLKAEPHKFSGFVVFISIILGLLGVAFGIFFRLKFYYCIMLFLGIFAIILTAVYFVLMLKADNRGKKVETVLPDALQLMSTNLRAGLTTDKALLVSAREEFGILTEELKRVGKEIATGRDIKEALMDITKRIKSSTLSRTINLIVFGITSGGELASLLEESAASLRQQMLTKKQVHAVVLMYSIFIFASVGFISPLLFGLSSSLVEIIVKSLANVEIPTSTAINMPFVISKVTIEPVFITWFSIIALSISAILSSLVLGLINNGEEKEGIKFIPLLVSISIVMFFIVKFLIGRLLVVFVSG
jgi:archaeal flagellar protein FlaJ